MAINTSKVVAGGLAAGVVLNIIDFLATGVLLADRMKADANAFKAGLGDEMAAMSGGQIAGYVIMNFVMGMILVWIYAGFRPRFGPGPKTATYVALVTFTIGLILTMGYMNIGMMSSGLYWTYAAIWLVNLLIASVVGAKVYSEDNATAP